MDINYSKEQLDLLCKKFDFLKSVRNASAFVAAVFVALFLGGFVAIYFGFSLLGVIALFVFFLPAMLGVLAVIMMNKFFSALKKNKVTIEEVGCQAWVREEENKMWHKITTYDNVEYYYFTEDPLKEISAGEKLHVLKYESKMCIPMAFDPIEQPKKETEDVLEVHDNKIEDKSSKVDEKTNVDNKQE